MADVVDRPGDVIDRDDVRVADLRPDQRHPLGQPPADLLDPLEEVVRPVDLVGHARLRVADHHARPVHPPRDRRLGPHDLLGVELRLVVGRRQVLALVEHVLPEEALVLAGDRDRRHVVEDPGPQPVRQLDRLARPADVRRARCTPARPSCRRSPPTWKKWSTFPRSAVDPRLVESEQRVAEVADHRMDPPGRRPTARSAARGGRPTARARARGSRRPGPAASRPGAGR